ncbi:MAG: hypothetical protein L6R42_009898 [Xanthoria sp. 1 TBL-2021]|nr:MAG: hypothetical protein L6R42_009898 [Xanthoria sp. 1 TBL-2021]
MSASSTHPGQGRIAIVPIRSKTFNYCFIIPDTAQQFKEGKWADHATKDSQLLVSDTYKMHDLSLLLHSRAAYLASQSENMPVSEYTKLQQQMEKLDSKAHGWFSELFHIVVQYKSMLPSDGGNEED